MLTTFALLVGLALGADTGPITETLLEWRDAARSRTVPVKLYAPKSGGPYPVILFSHGLGGTRLTYSYLGKHWAEHGYIAVHLQHAGSDDGVWRDAKLGDRMGAMTQAANLTNTLDRVKDVRFAVAELEKLNAGGAWQGRLDLDKLGMAGHSFGALTTMLAAGQAMVGPGGGRQLSNPEPRVKAGIPMSTNVSPLKSTWPAAYAGVKVPLYHLTGTLDDSPIGNMKAADRRVPFDQCDKSDQFLTIFQDGDHMVFGGRNRPNGTDARFQDFIKQSTTAFWDAYLKGDVKQKAWLAGGAAKSALGADGTFEVKKR